ncbi:MAG: hypothetical protein M0Z77_00660 [Thermoplasmatales archaeon]|nr:hypothetical protein [Thermoplasmatales archaeon]
MTDKGREGFMHIRLGSYSGRAYLFRENQPVDSFPLKFTVYFSYQLDTNPNDPNAIGLGRKNPKVWRESVITLLAESEDQNSLRTLCFLESSSRLALRIDEVVTGLDFNEDEKKEFSDVMDEYKRKIEKTSTQASVDLGKNSEGSTTDYVASIYAVLTAVAWVKIAKKVRTRIWKFRLGKGKRRFLNGKNFVVRLMELQNYLSYSCKLIKRDCLFGAPTDAYTLQADKKKTTENIAKALEETSDIHSTEQNLRNIEFFRANYRDSWDDGDFMFKNKALGVTSALDKEFLSGNTFTTETGSRWYTSWLVLLSEMLALTSEIFIIYNNEVEKHAFKSISVGKLKKMTARAIRDFSTFHNIDVIQSKYYTNSYEVAKKEFGIERYHEVLDQRLHLFSDYVIGQREIVLETVLIILTVLLVLISTTVLIPHFNGYLVSHFQTVWKDLGKFIHGI